mgnify:CR=1 FL=1
MIYVGTNCRRCFHIYVVRNMNTLYVLIQLRFQSSTAIWKTFQTKNYQSCPQCERCIFMIEFKSAVEVSLWKIVPGPESHKSGRFIKFRNSALYWENRTELCQAFKGWKKSSTYMHLGMRLAVSSTTNLQTFHLIFCNVPWFFRNQITNNEFEGRG